MAPTDEAGPADAGWLDGWWAGARQVPSPNFGPRPADTPVELVVLHSISLPPGQYGGGEIERLFTNTLDWSAHPYFEQIRGLEVSAHFVIDRQGACVQYVSCEQRAWHAGVSTWRGRPRCNDWSIGIELEGLEGHTFEAAQYRALAQVLRAITQRYPVTEIVGHEHIAPGRKQDPGPGFDWVALSRDVGIPYIIDLAAIEAAKSSS